MPEQDKRLLEEVEVTRTSQLLPIRFETHATLRPNISSPLCRTAPQPLNLPSVMDFMANYVKPLKVVVHLLAAPRGRLLFEPLVVAPPEFCKCLRTHLLQPAHVTIQPVPFDLISGL